MMMMACSMSQGAELTVRGPPSEGHALGSSRLEVREAKLARSAGASTEYLHSHKTRFREQQQEAWSPAVPCTFTTVKRCRTRLAPTIVLKSDHSCTGCGSRSFAGRRAEDWTDIRREHHSRG